MADQKIKTVKELSKVLDVQTYQMNKIIQGLEMGSKESREELEAILKKQEKQLNNRKEYLKLLESIKEFSDEYLKNTSETSKYVEKQIESVRKTTIETRAWTRALREVNRALDKVITQNQEIFRISHDIQLEANMTWREYTKLYETTYEASRRLRREIGQSVFVAKDLIETQNKLLGTGWKDIRVQDLTNVSMQIALMQKTLGTLDERLINAFQMSYRQFGEQTDSFIHDIGNRLNAFSRTFGVHIGMLQGAVSDMMAANSFISRQNMQAQVLANENLIKAAALTGFVGMQSTAFLTELYQATMFGTMEEMAPLYQAGALIQGFDMGDFQRRTIEGDYYGAAEDLIAGIGRTFENVTDHYLRAEYMRQIGGAFGLSRDDILQITTNAENLSDYTAKIAEKYERLDTSMVDELSDLKVAVVDRIENFWINSKISEHMGSFLQEFGLYGLNGPINRIFTLLSAFAIQKFAMDKKIISLLSMQAASSAPGAGGMGALGLLGLGSLAIGAGIGANIIGSQIQQNEAISDTAANRIGGFLNVAGGALGGAGAGGAGAKLGAKLGLIAGPKGIAIGTIGGALIGAGIGIYNTSRGAQERAARMQEIEDEGRRGARERHVAEMTDNPIVNAINNQTATLSNVFNNVHEEDRKFQVMLKTYRDTTTVGDY